MKTASEILHKTWGNYGRNDAYTLLAMQEYAQQEATEFADWIIRRYIRWAVGWIPIYSDISKAPELMKTTDQLYKKYQDEKHSGDKK